MNGLDGLDLSYIENGLEQALSSAGFTVKEEYSDIDSRKTEGCFALWVLDSVKMNEAGSRVGTDKELMRGQLVFRVKLYGEICGYTDRDIFDEMCTYACMNVMLLRTYGIISAELEKLSADPQQKRLTRDMKVGYSVMIKKASS